MDRLTGKHYDRGDYYMECSGSCANDDEMCGGCLWLEKIINRLGAYEDTGLEPGEITTEPYGCVFYCNRKCNLDGDFCAEGPGCPREIDAETAKRLLELAQAEKEGRLVVFPKDARRTSTPEDDVVTLVKPGGDHSVKPCPFCGGNKIIYWQYRHLAGLRWRIACLDCMAMIDPGWVQQYGFLANMWNERAEETLKGCDEK